MLFDACVSVCLSEDGRARTIQKLGGLCMVTNDATILKIKHEVLYRVAKLAYDGEFDMLSRPHVRNVRSPDIR